MNIKYKDNQGNVHIRSFCSWIDDWTYYLKKYFRITNYKGMKRVENLHSYLDPEAGNWGGRATVAFYSFANGLRLFRVDNWERSLIVKKGKHCWSIAHGRPIEEWEVTSKNNDPEEPCYFDEYHRDYRLSYDEDCKKYRGADGRWCKPSERTEIHWDDPDAEQPWWDLVEDDWNVISVTARVDK